MHDIEKISWIEQLEVTGPIKSIMSFVDDLSSNYEHRLGAMQTDYQKDIEELIVCYKQEKEEFQTIIEQLEISLEKLQKEFKALEQSYKSLQVANKITEECLANTREELAIVTKELTKEQELLNLIQEKICITREQLEAKQESKLSIKKQTIEFIKLITDSKAMRDLLLSKHLQPKEEHPNNEQIKA